MNKTTLMLDWRSRT